MSGSPLALSCEKGARASNSSIFSRFHGVLVRFQGILKKEAEDDTDGRFDYLSGIISWTLPSNLTGAPRQEPLWSSRTSAESLAKDG